MGVSQPATRNRSMASNFRRRRNPVLHYGYADASGFHAPESEAAVHDVIAGVELLLRAAHAQEKDRRSNPTVAGATASFGAHQMRDCRLCYRAAAAGPRNPSRHGDVQHAMAPWISTVFEAVVIVWACVAFPVLVTELLAKQKKKWLRTILLWIVWFQSPVVMAMPWASFSNASGDRPRRLFENVKFVFAESHVLRRQCYQQVRSQSVAEPEASVTAKPTSKRQRREGLKHTQSS